MSTDALGGKRSQTRRHELRSRAKGGGPRFHGVRGVRAAGPAGRGHEVWQVTESARAHSYYSSLQVQKTC